MCVLIAILLLIAGLDLVERPMAINVAPLVDHHQHLLSPTGAAL